MPQLQCDPHLSYPAIAPYNAIIVTIKSKRLGIVRNARATDSREWGLGPNVWSRRSNTLFPETTVRRMDRDTTSRKHSHQEILKGLESGKIDILVGTQMIVKGHDFPNVTFVVWSPQTPPPLS